MNKVFENDASQKPIHIEYELDIEQNDRLLTATFLQRVNRCNRVYQLKCLKGFLGTVLRDINNK